MANLPKIRRSHGVARGRERASAERTRPDVQRLEAYGLTWLNIESPTEIETAWLAEHYEFHPLDLEDVLSRRRQRAKIDEYDGLPASSCCTSRASTSARAASRPPS